MAGLRGAAGELPHPDDDRTAPLAAIPRLLSDPKVWAGLLESGSTMLAGFALAAITGVPIGFLMGRVPPVDRILQPYLDIALVMPMVVVMPIVMIAIGITRQAEVLVVWLFAAPYIIATTRAGVREVNPIFSEMAHCSARRSARSGARRSFRGGPRHLHRARVRLRHGAYRDHRDGAVD